MVGGGRVGHGFAGTKLIAAIEGAVGADDFEVEIIHQRGNGTGETGDIGVGERDFQRLIGGLHEEVLRVQLAVGEQDGLI